MVFKQIKLRNSGATITGLVMTLLLVIGVSFACFMYMSENGSGLGISLDDKYQNIYDELEAQQATLNKTSNDLKEHADAIVESGVIYETAWNGLKGLGATLKLPLQMTSTTLGVWVAIVTYTDFIPSWIIGLASIGIVTFVVLLVLRVLKGEPAV